MADSVSYKYDLNGRLKKLTFGNADEVTVQYDGMGNREEVAITIAPPLMLRSEQSQVPAPDSAADAVNSDEKTDPSK